MTARKRIGRSCSRWAILCVLASVSLWGCGGGKRASVTGTVTLNGQPLNGVIVEFAPDAAKGNTAAINGSGVVTDGRYELRTTAVTRAESGQGIPPGWYKVTVNAPPMVVGKKKKQENKPPDIPAKYLTVGKTPLEIEVKDNPEPGAYDLKLTH
jgi:hypothetical protein